MKIAQIDVNYGVGSTGKIVQAIHQFLLAGGHESMAFFGRGEKANDVGVVKVSNTVEVYLDAGLSRITGYMGVYSHFATNTLIEQLEKFEPDLVHLHELHGYYINQYKLLEYLKLKRIPIVWTLHCENVYTGRCGYAFDCDQWRVECVKCPRLNDYPKSLYFDRSRIQFNRKKELFKELDLITLVPVSNWLNSRVRQSFIANKKTTVVYNGIDVDGIFYPRKCDELRQAHVEKNDFIFLSVAPDLMSQRKGGQWVIDLAKRLLDKPVKFIMIGVKDANIDCPDNVIILPPLKNIDLLAMYYSMADVFLITSQKETFSLTTAEALACGTPVIGFDSGGPLEVAPKPFGYFFPFGDIQGLFDISLKLINGDVVLPSSDDCSSYARNNFGNNIMFLNYMKIYTELHSIKLES